MIADAIEGATTVSLNERASLVLAQEILDGLDAASFDVLPVSDALTCYPSVSGGEECAPRQNSTTNAGHVRA